jgi:hypothetical protein
MKFLGILIITMSTLIVTSHAQITQVNTMEEVFSYFTEADSSTLGVFDIDMVLLQTEDPAFQMANMALHRQVAKKVMQELPSEKREISLTLMTTKSGSVLVDTKTPKYLRQLSERKIPTIALTANLTGSFPGIANLESWKVDRLSKVGIDFSENAPYDKEIVFSTLPSFRGNYSLYVKGVLFANGPKVSKGDVLLAFFEETGFYPSKVIFIDDREDNLKSVAEALEKLDKQIQFHGLLYAGAKNYPSVIISEQEFQKKWEQVVLESKKID